MAAKKKSGKTRGTDESGKVLDTNSNADWQKIKSNFIAKWDSKTPSTRQESRNIRDFARNLPRSQPIPVGRVKDQMSGRTVEAGTRSMLEGQRGFMRGGGGLRSHGK